MFFKRRNTCRISVYKVTFDLEINYTSKYTSSQVLYHLLQISSKYNCAILNTKVNCCDEMTIKIKCSDLELQMVLQEVIEIFPKIGVMEFSRI